MSMARPCRRSPPWRLWLTMSALPMRPSSRLRRQRLRCRPGRRLRALVMAEPLEPPPELSRPVALDRIGSARHTVRILANDDERAALARRFGIPSVDRLEATATLRRVRAGHLIEVAIALAADVTQTCVVTLEPIAQAVTEAA